MPISARPAGRGVPAKLQANSPDALVYVAQAMGGGGWAKLMALSLALWVIASTGTGIVVRPDDMRDGAAPGAARRCWPPSSPGSARRQSPP